MKDFDAAAMELAQRQGGVATRDQLLGLGMSSRTLVRRVGAGLWVTVGPGALRLRGTRDDLVTRSRAIALVHPGAILTGPSAVALLGAGPWDGVTLGSRPWIIGARRLGFGARWLTHPGAGTRRIGGVLVADRLATIVDLLRFLPTDRAKAVAYRALQTNVVTLAQFTEASRRLIRCAGAPQLRAVLADAQSGARARSEEALIAILTDRGFTGWTVNARIQVGDRWIECDVVFDSEHVVIEVDGRAWHTTPDRFQADRSRQNALVGAGWTVLRYTWDDLVHRPHRVAAEISAIVSRKRAR